MGGTAGSFAASHDTLARVPVYANVTALFPPYRYAAGNPGEPLSDWLLEVVKVDAHFLGVSVYSCGYDVLF